MTNQEAIENLKELLECNYVDKFEDAENEALEMAIKALEQEPCDDAVSRKEVINQIFYSTDNNGDVVLGSALRERIARLPSVNPQEPKYCDRNICVSNEYSGIGCDECEVTKGQEPKVGE